MHRREKQTNKYGQTILERKTCIGKKNKHTNKQANTSRNMCKMPRRPVRVALVFLPRTRLPGSAGLIRSSSDLDKILRARIFTFVCALFVEVLRRIAEICGCCRFPL